jgi:hypothetical protein
MLKVAETVYLFLLFAGMISSYNINSKNFL